MPDQSPREQRGQTVRETWVAWAKRQRAPKHSWLVPWDDLDDGQREVDMLIGDAVAAGERERFRPLVAQWRKSAEAVASSSPQWSSHFYDCALELDRLIGDPDGN